VDRGDLLARGNEKCRTPSDCSRTRHRIAPLATTTPSSPVTSSSKPISWFGSTLEGRTWPTSLARLGVSDRLHHSDEGHDDPC
jgi:hypothetical protein